MAASNGLVSINYILQSRGLACWPGGYLIENHQPSGVGGGLLTSEPAVLFLNSLCIAPSFLLKKLFPFQLIHRVTLPIFCGICTLSDSISILPDPQVTSVFEIRKVSDKLGLVPRPRP